MANFRSKLNEYIKRNDTVNANRVIMFELGNILVRSKQDFVDLLNYSNIPADINMTDAALIELFIANIHHNRRLLIGAAFLANQHNKQMGFDGTGEISNESVNMTYKTMYSFFDAGSFEDVSETDDYYGADGKGAGVIQAISDAVQQGAALGTKITEGQQKKKYGAYDLANKKIDAKNQMIQTVLTQRQTEAELKKKAVEEGQRTTRTIVIAGTVLVATVLIIGIAIATHKKQKA